MMTDKKFFVIKQFCPNCGNEAYHLPEYCPLKDGGQNRKRGQNNNNNNRSGKRSRR